jgi:hypothetical protein
LDGLQTLDLWHTKVSEQAAKKLLEALPRCHIFR